MAIHSHSRPPVSIPSGRGRWATARQRMASSTSTLVTTSAVNSDTTTPTDSVTPNPRTAPEARKNSNTAASSVVTLESAIALSALRKPRSTAGRNPAPARCSSFMRSNTSTLASTAMPMASTNPAIPGSVRVDRNPSSTANNSSP